MKRTLLFIACVLTSLTLSAQDDLTVGDIQNSGCLSQTRGEESEPIPTIVLTKEGSVLSVQLLNYDSNCATTDFNVTSAVNGGNDDELYFVNISVVPRLPDGELPKCFCPYNVSFTLRDLKVNSFYLSCWWYNGMVELTEGEPMVLENKVEIAYLPFVKDGKGKRWHVVRSELNSSHTEQYMLAYEDVVKDGKTYLKMNRSMGDLTEVQDMGLLREEDRKVYFIAPDMQEEHLMFDYSLKEGDTYETYSYDEEKMVTYKVVSVEDYLEGPEFIRYIEKEDGFITQHRYLRKWTVCRTDDKSIQKVWIEGVGSIEGPLGNLHDEVSTSARSYLAYVEDYYYDKLYLPFTINDVFGHVHGCDLPTEADNQTEYDEHHRLTYELEGERLHVYGEVFSNCGPNDYAFFYEKPTDDPLVHRIEFEIQEVEPLYWCMALHATDFYVSGFDPNLNYIVVDNQGEEHPVINKTQQMAYRPFVEEGKVWKVGYGSHNPIQFVEYYYFDSDTIIDGKTCKQMMCQRYVTPDYADYEVVMRFPLLRSSGNWYEEDKKVYVYDTTNRQFKLMYDFSVDANAPLQIHGQSYVIGPKQSGGMKGFKGVYRDVMMLWDEEQNTYNTTWLEGVGGIEGPKYNVYLGEEYHGGAFLMSCTVGEEVIYLNDEYEDGATPAEARKRRIDFTHTIKIQPKARIKREKNDACINSSEREVTRPEVKARMRNGTEESMYGEYNDQQLCINLDPLDDTYQVNIIDESGKTVYEKDIDAGNIVGLNIDISTYAKGRYTVTVENSGESFTGEFGADNADANGDGEVNVADVDFVIEHIGEALDEKNRAADVNSDGEINVADVDYIIERIV